MLPKISAKRPMTIIVCIILVITLGVISFTKMRTDLLPEFDLPYVMAFTTYPGASPQKVEQTVTKPLESALSTTGGLKNLTSISSENTSIVILEFAYSTNMDSAMIEMNGSIDLIKGYFDDSVSSTMLMQIDPDMIPVTVAAISLEDAPLTEASNFISETVVPEIERIEGVASVSAIGLVNERIEITLKPEALEAINDKLFDAVDSEMADAAKDIEQGYDELEEGRTELETQLESGESKLLKAQREVTRGMEQIESAIAALDGLESSRESLLGLAAGYNALPQTDAAIMQAESAISALDAQISLVTDPDQSAALISQRDEIVASRDALSAQKSAVLSGMAAMGVSDAAGIQLKIAEIDQALLTRDEKKTELSAQYEELKTALAKIRSGKKQLETAREDGAEQLDTAQEQLDSAKDQYDTARENALEAIDMTNRVTEQTVASILAAENFSMPAGYAYEDGESYSVKVGERFASVEEVENLLLFDIEKGGVGKVFLKDVAGVVQTTDAGGKYAKINGNNGILITVQKQSAASSTAVSSSLRDAFGALEQKYSGLSITALSDQGVYIDIVTQSVIQNLLIGAVLAIIILWVFLKSIKPTLIVALSIPISLLLTVTLMYFTGITLNLISLAGLALGVGMLVDNSIVVVENIYRLRATGMSTVKAAIEGAREMGGAIIASTLTTVCVFLPIVFAEGIARELFVDMGLTIGFSLLSSLIVALTVVPALGSLTFRTFNEKPSPFYDKLLSLYTRSLTFVLRRKAIALVIAVLLLAASVYAAVTAGTAFMPESDSMQLMVSISLPEDTELTTDEKNALADSVSERVLSVPGVDSIGIMSASSGGFGILSSDGYTAYALLSDGNRESSSHIASKISEACKDLPCTLSVSSGSMDISMLSGSGIEIVLYGEDHDTLRETARDVAAKLATIQGIASVDDGVGDSVFETVVRVDKNAAMAYGLTVAQVYSALSDALKTEYDSTEIDIGSASYDVVIKPREEDVLTRAALEDVVLEGMRDGEKTDVMLSDIADIYAHEGTSSISRSNSRRTLSVTGSLESGYNIGHVSDAVEAEFSAYNLPAGVTMEFSGENETINDTLGELITMALLAVLLIYLIMVAQFQSLKSPFIVMFTMPLAFTGGFLLEWICGFELSVISVLGLLVLLGVVVNNGIVFVDCANSLYSSGMERQSALCETGRRRMRPILMTAMTTVLALVTLALGLGKGASLLQPMAVMLIGGLVYGTLTTLYIIPALYDLFMKKPPRVSEVED